MAKLVILVFSFIGFAQDLSFYKTVLNDFSRYSNYLVVSISSERLSGKVVVENDDLFRFLKNTRGFNKEDYISFMLAKLPTGDTIAIKDADWQKYNFRNFKYTQKVPLDTTLSADQIIAKYFEGKIIDGSLSSNERRAVVALAFERKILVFFGHESGFLFIK